MMSRYERAQGEVDSEMVCAACGKGAEEGRRVLARCIRCQGVWYCDKVSSFARLKDKHLNMTKKKNGRSHVREC